MQTDAGWRRKQNHQGSSSVGVGGRSKLELGPASVKQLYQHHLPVETQRRLSLRVRLTLGFSSQSLTLQYRMQVAQRAAQPSQELHKEFRAEVSGDLKDTYVYVIQKTLGRVIMTHAAEWSIKT